MQATGCFGYCILRPADAADQCAVSLAVSGAADTAIFGLAVQTDEQLDRELSCHRSSVVLATVSRQRQERH